MKTSLVESHRERVGRIESGEQKVVGQNVYTEAEPSPLQEGEDGGILTVDPQVEQDADRRPSQAWRSERDEDAVRAALERARARPRRTPRRTSCPPRSPPPRPARRRASGQRRCARSSASTAHRPASAMPPRRRTTTRSTELRDRVERVSRCARPAGSRSSSASPVSTATRTAPSRSRVRARDVGMDVVYEGIRLTPARIAAPRSQEGVHVVGLSILSGSHRELIPQIVLDGAARGRRRHPRRRRRDHPAGRRGAAARRGRRAGLHAEGLRGLNRIMGDIVDLVAERAGVTAAAA